jgi:predicted nucleotidyltransferase component of viral defense system
MLTRPQVQRYSVESGLRDLMIAEKEIVLTYLLELLSQRGILNRLAFKGGTCLRKIFLGSQGRFSTDLDFTGTEEHDHEDIILDMMQAFDEPFHGIQFEIPDGSYYETEEGESWGANPVYRHDWNASGVSEVRIQVSRRETPSLPPERRPQVHHSYFAELPFPPAEIVCLRLTEILAEKIRACYQRNKARDIYDLGMFARRPLRQTLLRRLVVMKLWQARDTFVPERLLRKFENGREFDWNDLRELVRRTQVIDRERICADCSRGFAFLAALTEDERRLAADRHRREQALSERLRAEVVAM